MNRLLQLILMLQIIRAFSYYTASRRAVTFIETGKVKGWVHLQEFGDIVFIKGFIIGLTEGEHGFHVHKLGKLGNGCKDAGPHYNPFKVTHGEPKGLFDKRHVGDLGNIHANSQGVAKFHMVDNQVMLRGPISVIGRAIVIHAKNDDLGKGGSAASLASGDAGSRVACGVIQLRH